MMKMSPFTVIYEPAEDGWWIATVPEFPGAFSQGATKAEALENVIDAMEQLMAARRELALQNKSADSVVEPFSIAS